MSFTFPSYSRNDTHYFPRKLFTRGKIAFQFIRKQKHKITGKFSAYIHENQVHAITYVRNFASA